MIRPLQEEVRSHLRSGVAITNLTQCVEELILNSLDAEASCITVRIDIPNFKIQVSDNGNGIAFEDLKSVGERYSSSKCHVLEDLQQPSFYGFRGEALASLREMCDVLELVTRHRSSYHTYCKIFRNSQVLELTESRFPRTSAGTSVTIHGIFANLPVRRKAISEILDFERVRHRIASVALIHPKTSFLLINDSTGSKCLQTHVCKSVVSTFSQLFGNQRSKNLQPVTFEHKNFKVSGFISTDTHHSKSLQFLFVNGRLLLKTSIHKLVNNILGKSELLRKLPLVEVKESIRSEGYQSKTTSPQHGKIVDKYGIFVLNIECLVTEFDICLEPAKTLIEFQDWDKVLYCTKRCIEEFLIKNNLILNFDDSANSTESEANDDDCHSGDSWRPTNLEAFEYKREIETCNVKKSLHSSTVFRSKRECVSQEKTSSCIEKGLSDFLLSDRKLSHINCDAKATSNDFISGDLTALGSESVSRVAVSDTVTVNVDKHFSFCTNKDAKHLNESTKQVACNDKTTCHVPHTEGCASITKSVAVKEVQNETDDIRATADLVCALSDVSNCCVLSDLEHISSSHSGDNGVGHHATTLLNDLSNKNGKGRVCTSSTFTRTTCDKVLGSSVSVEKPDCLPVKRNGSGFVHSANPERFIPLSSRSHDPEPSVTLRRRTETSNTKINKARTFTMPAFTSPRPITLKGQRTRKRHQSSKETSVAELALPSKNRKLITLHGGCQRRVRGGCNNAGQLLANVKDGEGRDCDTNCSHNTHKPEDNCSSKLSATSGDNIVTRTGTCTLSNTAICNSEVNCDASISGLSVPIDKTFETDHSNNLIQQCLGDSGDQMCGTRFSTENKNCEEHDSLSCVGSNLNVTAKQRNAHKRTEYFDCAQKESEGNEVFLEQDENHCSVMAESNSEPKLISVDNNDIDEGPNFPNEDWHCTFDVLLGKKVFINTRTGHSSFQAPCGFNIKDDDCSGQIVPEANEIAKHCSQHLPHPCASHLSFSCTPWLPRGDRRRQKSVCDDGNGVLCSQDLPTSQLNDLYKQDLEQKETEEKLCKWKDANVLQAYEQDVLNNGSKTAAQLLGSWQNPVFTAPEKDILMINKAASDKTQVLIHNVVHPYCFTRDMLTSMRVLRQLDEKFIVGIVSQEGEIVSFKSELTMYPLCVCMEKWKCGKFPKFALGALWANNIIQFYWNPETKKLPDRRLHNY